MTQNLKQIVSRGYDLCGRAYNEARKIDPSPELALLINALPQGARVLDIGCGGGVPVAATLVNHATVVGVDISSIQVEQARSRVPQATIIHGDIMDKRFGLSSFEGVVMLYTLFHLPREQHRPLLERVAGWLSQGGHLLATAAESGHPGYTEEDFFGATMYWSHFEPQWYEAVLRDLGFAILHRDVMGHGYKSLPDLPEERHSVIFARLEHRSGRTPRTMTAERALEILTALRSHGVTVSVDGGWGVDALVGRQTRPHEDLDLVVALADLDAITSALHPLGFSIAEDHLPVRFVMRDTDQAQLDFHAVSFDGEGGGVQPQPGGGSFRYPPEGFVGGHIAEQEVPCISAQVQVLCHLGYEPGPKDVHDVLLLCRHFNLTVPSRYQHFSTEGAT